MGMVYTDRVTIRAGATPQTFDGAATIRFNEFAKKIVGIGLVHSLSTYTTDEGYAMAIKLSGNAGLGSKDPVFFMGMAAHAGPTTNTAAKPSPPDKLALDIDVEKNTTLQIDISTIAGATQTGTHDIVVVIYYSDGAVPQDVLNSFGIGMVPVKSGSYGYATALATTVETALTGNGTTLNVAAEAKELVGAVLLQILDTAVTAAEELGGHVRMDYGLGNQAKQEYPSNGGVPGIGTEVEGGDPLPIALCRQTIYIDLKSVNRELTVSGFVTAMSAITGGADWALNLLWR